jgi:hypothetical protein
VGKGQRIIRLRDSFDEKANGVVNAAIREEFWALGPVRSQETAQEVGVRRKNVLRNAGKPFFGHNAGRGELRIRGRSRSDSLQLPDCPQASADCAADVGR